MTQLRTCAPRVSGGSGSSEAVDTSKLLLLANVSELVDLVELRPGVRQGKQDGLADDVAQFARQKEIAQIREVVEILFVVLVGNAENVARRETAREYRPRDSHAAEDEAQIRMFRWSRNRGEKIPGSVDLSRPELHERQILQLRKVAVEILDDALDDARVVVSVLQESRDWRAPAEEQPVVSGQPEVRVHKL